MILVIGAKGMLGKDLMELFAEQARGVDIEDIDITDFESIRKTLLAVKPRIVINAAAYTDVDGCESDKDTAMAVNGEGAAFLAMVTAEIGAKFVQISTDYVFDGTKGEPYEEDDAPHPMSVYGESKYAGELNAKMNPYHLVVRTQWLYGLHGKNFVETMLRLGAEKQEIGVVDDQTGSPTWTVDLARAIKSLLDKDCRGVYHAANSGFCTWNEFSRAIFSEAGMTVNVKPITTEELGRPAPRPSYSTLDCGKLRHDTGMTLPIWSEALHNYLQARRKKD